MKRLLATLAGVLAFAATTATAQARPYHEAACAKGKALVDVHYTLLNDADSGFAGNAWAMDTIKRHLRIWQNDDGTYCAVAEDKGTFTTLAGPSPSGFSTVEAGITGKLKGGYVTTDFSGTFAPSYATHGDLGTFDLACDTSFNCPGVHPSPLSYFSTTSGFDLAQWGWLYRAGDHGTWLNALGVAAADSGDITG
ncbi:MAG: hypothetical protein ACYDA3_10270 [Gaiellaceae bacterium]